MTFSSTCLLLCQQQRPNCISGLQYALYLRPANAHSSTERRGDRAQSILCAKWVISDASWCVCHREGELFNFDAEVEPLLEVLVGKVLEQALMEVSEQLVGSKVAYASADLCILQNVLSITCNLGAICWLLWCGHCDSNVPNCSVLVATCCIILSADVPTHPTTYCAGSLSRRCWRRKSSQR